MSEERPAPSPFRQAQDEVDRLKAADALAMQGLDEAIALMRTHVLTLAAEKPDDTYALVKSATALARLIATRDKLSTRSSVQFTEGILNVFRDIGKPLLPDLFRDL